MLGVSLPVKFKIKVVQVGNSLKVTIPKEIAEHIKLKKGDTVLLYVDDHKVILEKQRTT